MRRTATAVAFAATLALTGCSGSDEAEADAPLEFPDAQSLNEHVADRFNGTAELVGQDLTVMVESKNSELQDQDRTLKVLEDVGEGARFDYDTLTITAQADSGSWGTGTTPIRSTRSQTPTPETESIVVTEVWGKADTGTNNAY